MYALDRTYSYINIIIIICIFCRVSQPVSCSGISKQPIILSPGSQNVHFAMVLIYAYACMECACVCVCVFEREKNW